MKFVCDNKDCKRFGKEDEYFQNTYRIVNGEHQSDNAPCPSCGKIRREINPSLEIPMSEKNIHASFYSSASAEDRRDILKKRSHEHFKKHVEPEKEYRLQEAVKNFKEAGK